MNKELEKKVKRANFRDCLTCKHCVVYIDNVNRDRMICHKKHDIPKRGLSKCQDYEDDTEGVFL